MSDETEDGLDAWEFYLPSRKIQAVSVVSRYPTEAAARSAIDFFVTSRLVACAHVRTVDSTYIWEGSVRMEREWEIDMTTSADAADRLRLITTQKHPYQLPYVETRSLDVSQDYARWVVGCVTG